MRFKSWGCWPLRLAALVSKAPMLSHRFRTLRGMLEHRASNGSENVWYGLMVQLGGLFQARITQQKMKMAYPSSGIYIYIYIYTLHTYIHYITLHYITLHYITLHYITLHYITYTHTYIHTYIHTYMHCITLHYIALHCITLHYIALRCITLHYVALHCITLHYIALHCITLHYIALHCIALHYITLHTYITYIHIYIARNSWWTGGTLGESLHGFQCTVVSW